MFFNFGLLDIAAGRILSDIMRWLGEDMGLQPLRFRREDQLPSSVAFPDHTVRMHLQGLLFAQSLTYGPPPLAVSEVIARPEQAVLRSMLPMMSQIATDVGMPMGDLPADAEVLFPGPSLAQYTWGDGAL